jgi:sugar/nucleoside kinase (ribokinase family)
MAYDELVARLRGDGTDGDREPITVAAFPDGSVDTYYRVFDGETRVDDRQAFEATLAEGRDSVRLERERAVAGGQSVNMARQAHALGGSVRLAGHLDDPVFDAFDFRTVSMGDPSQVRVLRLGEDDLMLAEESPDIESWDVTTLASAVGDLPKFLGADLVCGANWSVHGAEPNDLSGLAEAMEGGRGDGGTRPDGDRPVFVFDPGSVGGMSGERHRALRDGLAALTDHWRVVLSVNPPEAEALAASLAADGPAAGETWLTRTRGLRRSMGLDGVVVHGTERAVAATADGDHDVPNLATTRVRTVTGAGDRFSAGLGYALAADWGWRVALQAGNGCASYHVVNEASASSEALASFVESRGTRTT